MIPSELLPIANHLWQSTLFAAIAGLLTLLLKDNRAHVRYCLWLAASAKFLVPFSLLVLLGSQFSRHTEPARSRPSVAVAQAIEQVNEPFVAQALIRPTPKSHSRSASLLVPIIATVWAIGFGALVLSRWLQWRRLRATLRKASPVPLEIGVPVLSSPWFLEPGIFGVFQPVLLLPDGIADHLSPAELQAILAHELCHVRRRDNLATVMHMAVEALFWFYPLPWWLGARLMEERERACDEEVLRAGSQPDAYAEGILKVCELYLQSPLKCVAGVTGANLKKRIEAIMDNRSMPALGIAQKTGLAMAGMLAVAIPVMLGLINAPLLRAQADPNLRFEVATVRRVEIPDVDGRVRMFPTTGGVGTSDPTRISYHGAQLLPLIAQAFGVRGDQITAPQGLDKERYDIVANIPAGATKEQFNVRMGNLLRDRLHLRFHIESRIIPVYALRVGKNGPKFKETSRRAGEPTAPSRPPGGIDAQGFPILPPDFQGMRAIPRPGEIFWAAQDVTMAELPGALESPVVGRPIIDETGLTGHYDFKIHYHWAGGGSDDPAPSVFTAVQEQLGLKLEPSTAPFDHLTIDSIGREPADN